MIKINDYSTIDRGRPRTKKLVSIPESASCVRGGAGQQQRRNSSSIIDDAYSDSSSYYGGEQNLVVSRNCMNAFRVGNNSSSHGRGRRVAAASSSSSYMSMTSSKSSDEKASLLKAAEPAGVFTTIWEKGGSSSPVSSSGKGRGSSISNHFYNNSSRNVTVEPATDENGGMESFLTPRRDNTFGKNSGASSSIAASSKSSGSNQVAVNADTATTTAAKSHQPTPGTPKTPESLLSMPAIQDRSHRRRLQLEREGKKSNMYDGESEPAGFRGQEARPVSDDSNNNHSGAVSPHLQLDIRSGSPAVIRNVSSPPLGFGSSGTRGPSVSPSMRSFGISGRNGPGGPRPLTSQSSSGLMMIVGDVEDHSSTATSEDDLFSQQRTSVPSSSSFPPPESAPAKNNYPKIRLKDSFQMSAAPNDNGRIMTFGSLEEEDSINIPSKDDVQIEYASATRSKRPNDAFTDAHKYATSAKSDQRHPSRVRPRVENHKSSTMATQQQQQQQQQQRRSPSLFMEEPDLNSSAVFEPEASVSNFVRQAGSSSNRMASKRNAVSRDPRKQRTKSPARDRGMSQQQQRAPSSTVHDLRSTTTSVSELGGEVAHKRMKNNLASRSGRYHETDNDSDTTESDDTLEKMMPDFLSTSTTPPRHISITPTSIASTFKDSKTVITASTASSVASSCRMMMMPDVDALNESAKEQVAQGNYDMALILFGQVLGIYKKMHGDTHPLVASTYHNLGMVHSQRAMMSADGSIQQRHIRQQSLECFQAAARSARDSLGKNHLNVAVSLVRIGFLLLQAKQYENAVVTFQEALRIRLVHFGHNPHALVANLYNNLGVCHLHLSKYEAGEKYLQKALDIQRHVLRIEKFRCTREELRTRLLEIADTLLNLGGIHLESLQGSYSERNAENALNAFSEAREIRLTVLGPEHPLVVQCVELIKRTEDCLNRSSQSAEVNPMRAQEPRATPIIPMTPSDLDQDIQDTKPKLPQEDPPEWESPVSQNDGPGRKAAPAHFSPPGTVRRSHSVEARSVSGRLRQSPPPPVSEVRLDTITDDEGIEDEEPSPSTPPRKIPFDKTNIFVSPHYIPRQSPPKAPISLDDTSLDEREAPPLLHSSGSESSSPARNESGNSSRKLLYEAEESCMINDSWRNGTNATGSLGFLQPDESAFHSSHEIVVVRPVTMDSPESDTEDKPRTGLAESPWGEAEDLGELPSLRRSSKKKDKADCSEGESDEGIAPLFARRPEVKEKRQLSLSKYMLDRPHSNLLALHSIAARYMKSDRLPEALHLFKVILGCQRDLHGELHEDVGSALHNVALTYLRLEQHKEASEIFEKASRVRRGSLGRDHPDVAVSLIKVGICRLLLHDFDMALVAFREALSLRKRALGALHPSTAHIYNNIGCVHVEFNELREARRAFEAALDLQRNALCHEPDSGQLMFGAATTLCNLGYLYRYRGMAEKAALVLKEALSLQEGVLGSSHPTTLSIKDSLAESLALSGGCAESLKHYGSILKELRKMAEADAGEANQNEAIAVTYFKMSKVHEQQRDVEAKLDKLQLALDKIKSMNYTVPQEEKKLTSLHQLIIREIKVAKEELRSVQLDWL